MEISTATEIVPHLWLGNAKDSQHTEFLSQIDTVINCTKDLPFVDSTKRCVRIPIDDNLESKEVATLFKYLETTTRLMDQSLRYGHRVLVHCFAGKQRSAALVAAYLVRYLDLTIEEAVKLIQSKRNIAFYPYFNFEAAIKLFEKQVRSQVC